MAIVASRPAILTTEVLIASNAATDAGEADARTRRYVVKNVTGTAAVFLGPSGVTTSNGFQWDIADGPLTVDLEPGESLYGIVASTTQTLHVLQGGR